MNKLKSIICLLALIALLLAFPMLHDALPLKTRELVAEKYRGWNGVLRLWIYEGWTPGAGNLSPWLNRCVSHFEKNHEGVYIQIQYVDPEVLKTFGKNGVRLPNMIIFPPALLETPALLTPIEEKNVRSSLAHNGDWQGTTYAVPIALGGYAWAYWLDTLPATFENEILSAPLNDLNLCWNFALTALCADRYAETDKNDFASTGDMDLGLTILEKTPAPSVSPIPRETTLLPRLLPSDFQQTENAWSLFINRKSNIMIITQREARRLENLSDQAKSESWNLGVSGIPFTDQLAMISIINNADALDQQALCQDFIDLLLSEEFQTQLYRAGAFSVTDAFSGYPAYDRLNIMESFLRRTDLIAAPAFGSEWVEQGNIISQKFLTGNGEAWTLIDALKSAMN